jgi:AcrR family transcriptional regulator
VPRAGEKTKRRITDAAYELFYKSGFARAGVDAIAEAAQMTKRTLYYHFDSKDSLMAAVLDAQLRRAGDAADRALGEAGARQSGPRGRDRVRRV